MKHSIGPVVLSLTALILTALSYAAGLPWLLPVVVVALVTCAFHAYSSWSEALAAGTIVPLAVLAGVMAALPRIGIPLVAGLTGTMLILGAASIFVLWRTDRWPKLDNPTRAVGMATLAVPIGVAMVGLTAGLTIRPGWSWALWNDALPSLLEGRRLVGTGGLTSSGPPDPLTGELLAVFFAPGHANIDAGTLLSAQTGRQAILILLILAWMSMLFSAFVAPMVPATLPVVRGAVAMLVGLLPWTWFVSGFAVRWGYLNALVSMVVLLATGLVWTRWRDSPTRASALCMLAALALLVAWAVFAVIAIGWGTWIILRSWRGHLKLRGMAAVMWLACFAFAGAYAIFVTLPSVRQVGEAGLTSNAQFFGFAAFQPGLILVILIVLSAITALTQPGWEELGGTAVFVAASLVGLGLLLAQRTGDGVNLWGYYPQKFAWCVSIVAIAMITRMITTAVARDLGRRRERIAAPLIVAVAAFGVLAAAPPRSSPLVATGGWGIPAVFPMLSIIDGHTGSLTTDLNYLKRFTPTLFDAAGKPEHTLLSGYFDDSAGGAWVNWSLVVLASQAGSQVGVRDFATFDLTTVSALCDATEKTGAASTVWTRDDGLPERFAADCPGVDVSIEVRQ